MIDTIVAMAGIFGTVGIGAGVYYKLGRLEQKLEFIYENCDISVTFKKRDHNGPKHVV